MDELTPKQIKFCEEYIIDLNGSAAAIRAGYSKNSANEQASRLLTKINVKAYIDKIKVKRSEKTGIDAAWVLRRLADEAEADIADLYDTDGSLKPMKEWPLIWRQGLVSGVDIEEIVVGGMKIGITKKVKLSDRIRRLELIGKHISVQAFEEVVSHKGIDGLGDRLARARQRVAGKAEE